MRRDGNTLYVCHISNIHQKIATNIRELRKKKQIAQEKLVLEANLNRAYISCIECGERKPSIDTLVKLAKAPDVKLFELFMLD